MEYQNGEKIGIQIQPAEQGKILPGYPDCGYPIFGCHCWQKGDSIWFKKQPMDRSIEHGVLAKTFIREIIPAPDGYDLVFPVI